VRWVIASDHAGFELKEAIEVLLKARGLDVTDLGTHSAERTDYPLWGHKVGEAIAQGAFERGVIVCGSGVGISIAANRHPGVRAALCNDLYTARMSRAHNDANVLALGARVVGRGVAEEIVRLFLETPFEGGRHGERLEMLDEAPSGRSSM
jgi:ribose 5-phosphate isomerase B